MYKIGDKVIVTKARSGWLTGKGTWGYVVGFEEDYDSATDELVPCGLEVEVHFYRKKGQKQGRFLPEGNRIHIFPRFTQVDLYSNIIPIQTQVIDKIKLMSKRQSFKFQGEYCG